MCNEVKVEYILKVLRFVNAKISTWWLYVQTAAFGIRFTRVSKLSKEGV